MPRRGYYEYRVVRIQIGHDDEMTAELMAALIDADESPALGEDCDTFEVMSVVEAVGELIYTLRRKNY